MPSLKKKKKADYVSIIHAVSLYVLKVMGSAPDLLHLIGFGVGAHIAGIAGSSLNGTIGRITGTAIEDKSVNCVEFLKDAFSLRAFFLSNVLLNAKTRTRCL